MDGIWSEFVVSAEDMLKGERVGDKTISKAAKVAAQQANPVEDYRATAQHRREMIEVLAHRAITQAPAN